MGLVITSDRPNATATLQVGHALVNSELDHWHYQLNDGR